MARRQHLTAMLALAVIIFLLFTYTLSSSSTTTTGTVVSDGVAKTGDKSSDGATADLDLSSGVLTGGAIAPKLENATAKSVNPPHRHPLRPVPPSTNPGLTLWLS